MRLAALRNWFGEPGFFGVFLFFLVLFGAYEQYDATSSSQQCSDEVEQARFEDLNEQVQRSTDATFLAYLRLSKQMLDSERISKTASAKLEANMRQLEQMGNQEDAIERRMQDTREGMSEVCGKISNIALQDAFLSVIATFLAGALGFGAGITQGRKFRRKKGLPK